MSQFINLASGGGGGGGDILTLTGDTGGPVSPDGAGNINVAGDLVTIDVTGDPGANTLVIAVKDTIADEYVTDDGTAIPSGNQLNVLGGDHIETTGTGNTVTINLDEDIATSYTTDDANSATPAAGNLNVFGGFNSLPIRNINTTSAGDTVTINLEESIHQPATNAIPNGAGSAGWYSLGDNDGTPIPFMHAYGVSNTFLGSNAGNNTLTTPGADFNVGGGSDVLQSLTTGSLNVALGSYSGQNITTGSFNTTIGSYAGRSLTDGDENCYIGSGSGTEAISQIYNCALGNFSLFSATSGNANTAIGYQSLFGLISGVGNLALGFQAGLDYYGDETDNILLANPGSTGENNTIRIGTNTQTRNFQAGIVGVAVANQNMVVVDTSTGQLGSEPIPTGALTWTEVTATSQVMAINNGYIANNVGLVSLSLPTVSALGSTIKVTVKGTGLAEISQNAGQTIHFGNQSTTTGATGYIEATLQYDSVEMVCITADTDWVVLSSVGNWTVV